MHQRPRPTRPSRRRPTLPAFAFAALLPLGVSALALLPSPRKAVAGPAEPVAVAPDPAGAAFFENKIRPLLTANCLGCHKSTGQAKGGLALDSQIGWLRGGAHGAAIVPGKPDESRLYQAVTYGHDDLQMPPSGKMTDAQIALMREWIARGAPDTRTVEPTLATTGVSGKLTGLTDKAKAHWAFQPIVAPTVPTIKDGGAWVKNPIDAFVLANLHSHDMHPNPTAPREALIRRAYYDMIGQPPTVGEVRAFLADRSPNAWGKVVDALLASPHYGERWGRHWLDSARYSDTGGEQKIKLGDYRYPYAWTYRDYVIKAINDDKPYNQFLVEQIAADKLPDIQANDPRLAALGFLTVGLQFKNPDDEIDERIDALTKSTMALTVSCARCHDHKFDPIPTADYYSLAGVFASTVEPEEKPVLAGGFDQAQESDYNAKLTALLDQNKDTLFEWITDRSSDFRRNAEGYLLASVTGNKSKERQEILEKYHLPLARRGESREILNSLRIRATDPVLGPFARLSKIPAAGFANASVPVIAQMLNNRRMDLNPQVRDMLNKLQPKSLEDVAHAYAGLFAQVQPLATDYVAAKRGGRAIPGNISAATAEIIDTPFHAPDPSELATPEAQLAYLKDDRMEPQTENKFNFPAINALRLTNAGAPGRAMVVADAPRPRDSFIHIRGDKNRPGATVPRQFLAVLAGPNRQPFTNGSGRLELARDIASPANPLTARTLVNRVWMYHFGDGFVRTPDDLGNQSEAPSNQKLMDYLAASFVKNGWSLKHLHREILMSSTYAESSADNPAYAQRDPDDRLMWRAHVRRLDFEAIRDSLVMLTGKLDPTIGGKPVNITDEPYTYRRSIYGYVDRGNMSDLMRQFDFSDPTMTNSARASTIVPQQALFFMNSPMTVDVARQLVSRPEVADATDDAARVTAIYLTLFQRSPRPEEIGLAQRFIARAQSLNPAAAPGANGGVVVPQTTEMVLGKNGKPIKAGKGKGKKQNPMAAYQKANQATRNPRAPIENVGLPVDRNALTPWELYAQALLCSNEFVYVD